MVEFIESIMCFVSLSQFIDIVQNNIVYIVIIGAAVIYGFYKHRNVNTCEIDIKHGNDRIRFKSRQSH